MDEDDFPIDPLLQQAAIGQPEPNPFGSPGGNDLDFSKNTEETDRETGTGVGSTSGANKRPRTDDDLNIFGIHSANASLASSSIGAPISIQQSLVQYVQENAMLKKLDNSSTQELNRFATASAPEREVMAFALGLEIRDSVGTVQTATVSNGMHNELVKNIKTYAGAAFFSPAIRYYSAPRSGKRSAELQNAVLDLLRFTQVPHMPPASDTAGEKQILKVIAGELTDYRSETKTELKKRKQGDPNANIGSFTAHVTRKVRIKITKAHYGRMAFLSREFRSWEGRDMTKTNLAKMEYWEWVDRALERVRKDTENDPGKVNMYFQSVISEDEAMFSKPLVQGADSVERATWQKQVEEATSRLPVAV